MDFIYYVDHASGPRDICTSFCWRNKFISNRITAAEGKTVKDFMCVLVHSGSYYKYLFLTVLETVKSKTRVPTDLVSSGEPEDLSEVSILKALIPFTKVPLLEPDHRPLPPNTITLGFKISTYEFEGDTVSPYKGTSSQLYGLP